MGQKESKEVQNDPSPKINHPRFTQSKWVNKNNQDWIEIGVGVASEKQYKNWQSLLKKAPNNDNLLLPVESSFSKEGYCGSSGIVKIRFPNFPYQLIEQISNRKGLKKIFQENQIWYLAFFLLSVGSQVHSLNQKVGDIRPQNIFINEDGQVKVSSVFSWPSQQTNYSKSFFQKEITYLAPQQIKDIQFGKMEPTANFQLAETFSIGLTILDVSTLTSSRELYIKNNKFDFPMLQSNLALLQSMGYSQILQTLIRNMCEIDTNKRQTCTSLYRWLTPYSQFITNLQNFQITQISQKLQYTYEQNQKIKSKVAQRSIQKIQSQPYSPEKIEEGKNRFTNKPQQIQSMMIRQQQYRTSHYVPPSYKIDYRPSQYYISKPPQLPQNRTVSYIPQINQSEFNLSKIDQQLQMSKKMFPS